MVLAHNPDNDQPVVSVQPPQKLEVEEVAEEEELDLEEAPAAETPEAEED